MKGVFRGEEYITVDSMEATYLIFKGFSCRFDRENPRMVKMIFKVSDPKDLILIKQKRDDFYDNSAEKRLLETYQSLKKSIIGEYIPDFYRKNSIDSVKTK